MTVVVFLRGINVGGHRSFRPSVLAKALSKHDVVNVGTAGTFVVRKPGPLTKLRSEIIRKLPFEAHVAICNGRDLMRIASDDPFAMEPSSPDLVRFVSILSKAGRARPSIPVTLPSVGDWFVRVIASNGRFVFGVYRRHMKTIGYLGQIDGLFGVAVTTRSWTTILAIAEILNGKRK